MHGHRDITLLRFIEQTFDYIRAYLFDNKAKTRLEHSEKRRDDSIIFSIKIAKLETNVNDEMDDYSSETSNNVATKTNVDASASPNVVSFSNEETISRYDTTFREAGAACPTKFMDWSEEKFTDDDVMKSVPADPRVERHAEDAFARENEDTRRNDNEAGASREFEAHLEIERDVGRSRETGSFEMKAEESSPEMFLVSILQESAVKSSKEHFDERIVDLAMDASKDREENRSPSSMTARGVFVFQGNERCRCAEGREFSNSLENSGRFYGRRTRHAISTRRNKERRWTVSREEFDAK